MYGYDTSSLIVLGIAMLLGFLANKKIQSAYKTYKAVPTRNQWTGEQIARQILDSNHLQGVRIEPVRGVLTDHYDPRDRVLRLSEGVYQSRSIAAAAVSAHEVGHALQHASAYAPLLVRNAIVPAVNIASSLSSVLVMAGFYVFFSGGSALLINIGIALFGFAVFFQIITLPVEFDASRRAMQALAQGGLLQADELPQGKKVLFAAALTYVAAALGAALQLLSLIMRTRRRDG